MFFKFQALTLNEEWTNDWLFFHATFINVFWEKFVEKSTKIAGHSSIAGDFPHRPRVFSSGFDSTSSHCLHLYWVFFHASVSYHPTSFIIPFMADRRRKMSSGRFYSAQHITARVRGARATSRSSPGYLAVFPPVSLIAFCCHCCW